MFGKTASAGKACIYGGVQVSSAEAGTGARCSAEPRPRRICSSQPGRKQLAARAAARLRPTTAVPWAYAPVQTAAPRRIYHQPCSSDQAGYAFLKRHLTVLAGLAGAAALPCAALRTTAEAAVSRSSASRESVRAGADYADRLAVREGTSRTPAGGARSIQFVSRTANNHGSRGISRGWRTSRAATAAGLGIRS